MKNDIEKRCVAIGETTGLYKGKMVSIGCTPDYLQEFIAIESGKRGLWGLTVYYAYLMGRNSPADTVQKRYTTSKISAQIGLKPSIQLS